MTTAATITANLILDSRGYQRGVKEAEAATSRLSGKLGSLTGFIQRNALAIGDFGDRLQQAGKKMTTFITVPILGFFALLIKKAIDADTAMGKLAKESLAKLNTSLAQLGEKFLPVFIKIVDWLTKMIDKFNQASPKVQGFILILIGMLALAGPLVSFIGTIMSVVSAISTIGTALTTVTPGIAAFGVTLWTALAPILPLILAIIAIIAGLTFVIWAFATDFMGVTTTLKQLIWIIGYEFKKLGQEIKQGWSEAMDWLDKETQKSANTWRNNFRQAEEIKQKLFKISVDVMLKWWNDFSGRVMAKVSEVRNWSVNAWNYVAGIFYNVFTSIYNFFNAVIVGIINGINALIGAVNALGFSLQSLQIPSDLIPGSPTPFEMGLRGIANAMRELSRESIPQFNQAFAAPNGIANVGAGKTINIVDNRRFAAGMDARTLRMALDDQLQGLTTVLEGV